MDPLFTLWLRLEPTIIAISLAIGRAQRKASLAMTLKIALIALLCVPVAHATSFWSAGGLHIAPVALLPFLYLVVTRQLDMRKHWFAVAACSYIEGLIPDVLGTWLAFHPIPTWYYGLGGYGIEDGLVVAPLLIVVSLFAVQALRESPALFPSKLPIRGISGTTCG